MYNKVSENKIKVALYIFLFILKGKELSDVDQMGYEQFQSEIIM